jgi:hypothetical protein
MASAIATSDIVSKVGSKGFMLLHKLKELGGNPEFGPNFGKRSEAYYLEAHENAQRHAEGQTFLSRYEEPG